MRHPQDPHPPLIGPHLPTTRRRALHWLAGGLGAAALPARLAVAAGPGGAEAPRLVVVMLRGALDGLAAVPALGDPAWAALRGQETPAAGSGPIKPLDGTLFGLHPALDTLHQWWAARELLVLHAVASPYRERSHFDAQQLLESGGDRPFALQTGWLGRALQASGQPAVALSPSMPVALRGAEQASTWTPGGRPANDEDLMARVSRLYVAQPALADAWTKALAQQGLAREALAARSMGQGRAGAGQANGMGGGMAEGMADRPGTLSANGPAAANGFAALARQAGVLLSAERGPRVAWLETGGWDTHTQQANRLQRQLSELDKGLAALRSALGPHWARSSVVVLTEFGRTAVLNGSGGTDHGSGGVAWLAGGAVAGGRVLSDWPGLAPKQLLDGRDLRPTQDVRALLGGVLQRQFGLSRAQMNHTVLPGAPSPEGLGLWRA